MERVIRLVSNAAPGLPPVRPCNPLAVLAASLQQALDRDLAGTPRTRGDGTAYEMRPGANEVQVYCYPSVRRIANDVERIGYVVVVLGPSGDACVYWEGRFSYRVVRPSARFIADLRSMCVPEAANAASYEAAEDRVLPR